MWALCVLGVLVSPLWQAVGVLLPGAKYQHTNLINNVKELKARCTTAEEKMKQEKEAKEAAEKKE